MQRIDINDVFRCAVSYIAPNCCPFCGKVIDWKENYCESCLKFLYEVKKEPEPPENISRLFACCYYIGRARKAVHMMKYGKLIYPVYAFGQMMSEKIGVCAENYDVLIPVSSSVPTIRQRGFSAVTKIAKQISLHCGLPVLKAVKVRDSKLEQKQLGRKGRVINAQNSFFVDKDLTGMRVLLVDDVMTTGSTISAIGGMLRNAGAADVAAVVFTKGVDENCAKFQPKKFRLKK